MLNINHPDPAITYATARQDREIHTDSTTGGGALSGGITNEGLPRLITSFTGDSVTVTRRTRSSKTFTETTWDAPRAVAFVVDVSPLPYYDGDTVPPKTLDETICYFATGNPAGGVAGFGFKVEGGKLYGVTHNGSEEQTHELQGSKKRVPDRGPMRLQAVHPGQPGAGGPVRFYDDTGLIGQSDGAVPHGDGGTAHEILWSASLENQTSADEIRRFDLDAKVQQDKV